MSVTMDLREINEKSENIYEAVIITAKRARQIHSKMTEELQKQLGEVENEEDLDEETVDREKIVRDFDKRDKPSVIAMKEFIDGKLRRKTEEEG